MPATASNNPCISLVIAKLILTGQLPMEGVALAGEVIVLDARILAYEGPYHKASTLNYTGSLLDDYEALLERCKLSVRTFSESDNVAATIAVLSELKQALAKLAVES